jgi:CMP-N-acetylneuraminic acid synthetase
MQKKFIALIPARGGSKRLPKKNLLLAEGVPLIGWAIRAALGCSLISHVFVSSEDDEIIKVSKEFGSEIINRPPELSTDTASSASVVLHAIKWLKKNNIDCEFMVLLQPTSPLRTSYQINEALKSFFDNSANHVVSVYEADNSLIKSFVNCDDGSLKGLYCDNAPYLRQQDLPKLYKPNGAIYAFSASEFLKRKNFPSKRVFPYIMTKYESDDIDTMEDFKNVEQKIKVLKNV